MIVTRKQFVEETGISSTHINTYANRGKIVLTRDGQIDLANPVNKKFVAHRKARQEVTEDKVAEKKGKSDKGTETLLAIRELERIKKSLDIQKTTEEVELLKIKKEKALGLVVPVDLTKDLFSRNMKYVVVEFDNATDHILTMVSSKYKLSNDDVASYRGQIKKRINEAIKDAVSQVKKEIDIMVDEFSEKRSAGEKV